MNLEMKIEAAIEEAKSEKPSREMSLVITKLQEAQMWLEFGKKINE
mgnify:CR=1 FL=1